MAENRMFQILPIPFIVGAFVLLAASTGSNEWVKSESHVTIQFVDHVGLLCQDNNNIKECIELQFSILRDIITWKLETLLIDTGFKFGLWEVCLGGACRDWGTDVITWIGVVRAAMLLSLILLIAGFAGCIIRLLAPKAPKWLFNIFHWGATISSFIGVVTWILRSEESAWLEIMDVGWGHIVAWVGVILSLMASIVATIPEP